MKNKLGLLPEYITDTLGVGTIIEHKKISNIFNHYFVINLIIDRYDPTCGIHSYNIDHCVM